MAKAALLLLLSGICAVRSQTWTTTGSCTTSGVCVRSDNFGTGDYMSSHTCTITLNTAGYVTDSYMSTEMNYDQLQVGGTTYSGRRRRGASNGAVTDVYLSAGSTITWTSDTSIVFKGFELCYSSTAQNSRRRASSSTYPTVHTTFPAYVAPSSSCGGCDAANWAETDGCAIYSGECGGLSHSSNCWSGSYCYASNSDQCCDVNVGAVLGIVAAVSLSILAGVLCCCFLCRGCPGYKCLHKNDQTAHVQQPQPVVMAGGQLTGMQPYAQPYVAQGQPVAPYEQSPAYSEQAPAYSNNNMQYAAQAAPQTAPAMQYVQPAQQAPVQQVQPVPLSKSDVPP